MRDYFKPKTWLITILMFLVAFGLSLAMVYYEFGLEKNIEITHASANDNVSGWAWNSNTGWISFNCTSDPACSTYDYGVKIDLATGYFSGYAWSSNVGWISFNRSDTGDPPANPYKNGSGPIAVYDFSTPYQVTGWAKILSLGDNGWIKLRKSIGSEPDYGVSIDPANGNFSGWAWNANDGGNTSIGWISFNCANDSSCGASNYKVVGNINRPPTVTNLTAPNWNFVDAAGVLGALNARPSWTFNDQDAGSSESAYQLKVNTINNVDDPNPVFDSGKCLGQYNPINKCLAGLITGTTVFPPLGAAYGLNYNTAYYWWVQVWDNYGATSGWTQFNTNIPGHVLTDNQVGNLAKNPTNPNLTFTTYKHEMPIVNFSWFPVNPSKGEKVKFTDKSKVYSSLKPSTAVDCTDSSVSGKWYWTAPGASITGDKTATPIITFNSTSNQTVTLKVTDQDGYYISHSETINVNANLPGWKEVKPE